ncbi:MAG: GAF domain-containing protein [Saprospiraceae bacterium]|jgi:GAF domain-containing protein
MSASTEMPYFIKPSVKVSEAQKKELYHTALHAITLTLADESDESIKMVTINSLLKTHLPYFYWVGFYLFREGRLVVGPYQGTLGCLYIQMGQGVCGKAAATQTTQIVGNVHLLEQGAEHIACDPNSASEIVVPVLRKDGSLLGVLDVDSTLPDSFSALDATYLEQMVQQHF